MASLVWTPERDALLAVEYPGGRRTHVLRDMLNAMPGRPVTDDAIRQRAKLKGLKRTAEFKSQHAREASEAFKVVIKEFGYAHRARPFRVWSAPVVTVAEPAPPVAKQARPFSMLGGRVR